MKTTSAILAFLALGTLNSSAVLVWTVGNSAVPNRATPEISNLYGVAGSVTFVQENNNAGDALPGNPNSPAVNQQADDDFYFEGVYNNQVALGAAYTPLGIVGTREISVERAITGGDTRNRFHFNFSNTHAAGDLFRVSFGMIDLDDNGTGTGSYTFNMFMNGRNIGTVVHTAATINTPFVSNAFNLASVGATAGSPDDNYVELVSSNPGGSTARWSNFDYIRLDVTPVPEPSSLGFLAVAVVGLGLIRRRRRA